MALLALTVLTTFCAFVTTAWAAPAIEGVWSFNGGSIAIRETGPGVFAGTVVAPTTFSFCAHPEGEEIWTQMREQPDGSFWGMHQWFFETSDCTRNPALGPTAWRVMQNATGRYLRACFSEPGSNLQPTIGADGASGSATFGCVDSALLSVVPDVSTENADQYIHLPGSKSCLRGRRLRVRIAEPKNDPIKQVKVTAKSLGVTVKAAVRETKRGRVAVVPLERLPGTVVTVRVRLITLLGQKISIKRTYHRCRAGSGG